MPDLIAHAWHWYTTLMGIVGLCGIVLCGYILAVYRKHADDVGRKLAEDEVQFAAAVHRMKRRLAHAERVHDAIQVSSLGVTVFAPTAWDAAEIVAVSEAFYPAGVKW